MKVAGLFRLPGSRRQKSQGEGTFLMRPGVFLALLRRGLQRGKLTVSSQHAESASTVCRLSFVVCCLIVK